MDISEKMSRGLTLVNMLGTLAIIWLAGSFIFQAERQRRDANWSLQSIRIQETLYEANTALEKERFEVTYLKNGSSDEPGENTSTLKELFSETDKRLDQAIIHLSSVATDEKFLSRILFSDNSLGEYLAELRVYRAQISAHRNHALSQSSPPSSATNSSIVRNPHDRYGRVSDLLDFLGTGVQYYPSYRVPETSGYINLLNDLRVSYGDLMQEASQVAAIVSGYTAISADQPFFHGAIDKGFENSWSTILARLELNGISEELVGKVQLAYNFYLETYSPLRNRVLSSAHDSALKGSLFNSWKEAVFDHAEQLSDSQLTGYKSQVSLALGSLRQAERNLLLDAIILLIFLGIAQLLFLMNKRMRYQSIHDGLTGLPNRAYLENELQRIQNSHSLYDKSSALIYLDLDRFKVINDSHGTSFGNKLLKLVTGRLLVTCAPDDFIARLGGDEFAIVRYGCESRDSVMDFTAGLIEVLGEEYVIDDIQLSVGVSAGICIAREDCPAGPELMNCSGLAMSQSKANSLSRVGFYSTEKAENYRQRVEMEQELKLGIARDQFELVYQPKVSCDSDVVVGVEALLRWQHPDLGNVSPAKFVPIAEEANLMGPIGKWVIQRAFNDIAMFNRQYSTNLHVAVNISAQQFADLSFFADLSDALDVSGLHSDQVELELTESMIMTDIMAVNTRLAELKNKGIKVAVDDFGTGYSSLQYLQELSLDVLKIDRAFVVALDSVDPKYSVANSIVQLARIMNLKTVAEGVESNEQCVKVRSLGVDIIQGYIYSKPVPVDELHEHLIQIRMQLNPGAGYEAVA